MDTKVIEMPEALAQIHHERTRIHRICAKMSQQHEDLMQALENLASLERRLLGTQTYNPQD